MRSVLFVCVYQARHYSFSRRNDPGNQTVPPGRGSDGGTEAGGGGMGAECGAGAKRSQSGVMDGEPEKRTNETNANGMI